MVVNKGVKGPRVLGAKIITRTAKVLDNRKNLISKDKNRSRVTHYAAQFYHVSLASI